jgi:hypothetical protein
MMGGVGRWFRILCNFATAMSALLFFGAALLCIRSYQIVDLIHWHTPPSIIIGGHLGLELESSAGRVGLVFDSVNGIDWYSKQSQRKCLDDVSALVTEDHPYKRNVNPQATMWHWGGVGLSSRASYLKLVLPDWALLLFTSILPGVRLLRWRLRRVRTSAGCCGICWYDLRATPGRCPECGTNAVLTEI